MPELSQDHLFSPSVPAEWAPLLDDLTELAALTEGSETLEERRARASELHPRILERAERWLGQALPPSLERDDPDHVRRLCEAVLLWPHFARVGGRPLVDSLALESLAAFPIDLPADVEATAALRGALSAALGVSEVELDEAQAAADLLVGNLAVKHAICEGLARVSTDPSGRLELFEQLYGEVGWQVGEVDLVVTWSHVFLCLPYEGVAYVGEHALEGERAERIGAFLERVRDQNTFITGRFPAFGTFDAEMVDPALLDAMMGWVRDAGLEVRREVVAQTLPTMVTITPTPLADQYLVHDCWGHGWQEALCDFEWLYGELTKVRTPIGVDDLIAALSVRHGRVHLDETQLLARVGLDLQHRILCAHHAHTSEVLADLIEHKLVRHGQPLPSSSLLPEGTVKLDLSLTDALTHARVWGASWRRFWGQPDDRARVVEELVAHGLPEAGLAEAIDRAAARVRDTFGAVWPDQVGERRIDEGRLQATTFERIWLQSAAIDAELTKLMDWGERVRGEHADRESWRVPEASMDLISLILGWVYEQDPGRHVWFLDDYAESLKTFLAELGAALRA